MRTLLVLIFILGIALTPHFSFAQTSEDQRRLELYKILEDLENQLKQINTGLASERAKKESLQREITVMKGEIQKLEVQITLNSKKINKAEGEIEDLEGDIFDTQERISKQKGAIGRLILFLNRHDNENLLTTILKNKNISKFFRDEQYAANISTELLGNVDQLKEAREELESDKKSLESKKGELEELNQEAAAKRASLRGAQATKDQLLKVTKGQEAAYQKMVAEIERKQAEFFTELRILENQIVEGGLYIVHVTATSVPPKGTKLFQWPMDGYRLTQGYGYTSYARSRRRPYGGQPHNGIDVAAGYGDPVKSIGDGTVVANGKNSGFGNWIAVKHANGMVSLYAHNSSVVKAVGTDVRMGETIAYEGNTGHVTGSHLHLSLYKDFFTYEKSGELYFNYFDGSLNPLDYL